MDDEVEDLFRSLLIRAGDQAEERAERVKTRPHRSSGMWRSRLTARRISRKNRPLTIDSSTLDQIRISTMCRLLLGRSWRHMYDFIILKNNSTCHLTA